MYIYLQCSAPHISNHLGLNIYWLQLVKLWFRPLKICLFPVHDRPYFFFFVNVLFLAFSLRRMEPSLVYWEATTSKKSQPTDPNIFGFATGNETFFEWPYTYICVCLQNLVICLREISIISDIASCIKLPLVCQYITDMQWGKSM